MSEMKEKIKKLSVRKNKNLKDKDKREHVCFCFPEFLSEISSVDHILVHKIKYFYSTRTTVLPMVRP